MNSLQIMRQKTGENSALYSHRHAHLPAGDGEYLIRIAINRAVHNLYYY